MRYSPCPLPLPAAAGVFCRHGGVQAAFSAYSRRVIMPPTQSTENENERDTQTVGFLAAADGEMGTENRPAAADGGGIERAGGLLARACCAGAGCIHGIPNRKAACTREFGAVEQGAHAGIVFLGQLVRDLPAHVARYPAPARRWRARAGRGGAFGQPSGSARLPATAPLDVRYAERRTRRLVAGMAGEGNADHRAGAAGQSDTQHHGAGELLGLEAARGVGRCVGSRQMAAMHGKQKILHEAQPGGCHGVSSPYPLFQAAKAQRLAI